MSADQTVTGGHRRVRFGVLGCAEIARRKMMPALQQSSDADLVAVASRTAERAQAFATTFGCAAIAGYSALLDRADIDAVYLPLPSGLHAQWARAALSAGKHVLVEKPAVLRAADAAGLADLAARRRLVLMENFMFLHHGQHEFVADLVTAGAIGRLQAFTCDFGIPPRPVGDIRNDPGLGGGALYDVGVYPLRAATFFLGSDLEIAGATRAVDRASAVDIAGAALLRNAAGVSAQLAWGFRHSYRAVYSLWGDAGRIELRRAFSCPADWRPIVEIERDDGVRYLTLPADDQFRNAVDCFIRAVRSHNAGYGAAVEIQRQADLVEGVLRRGSAV
ncbi:Gfo/Idh/MocA family oxidoreductase [Dactylosporangium sp. NPDC051485]|uniref:Gfo/Idh/MocA family protein n=1 Tax=Dactylosporangium sp. NPDC051485 TaxID=3154846 RepID=UPI0034400CA3